MSDKRYCPHEVVVPFDCYLEVSPDCEQCWNERRELLEDSGYWNEKLVKADEEREEAERLAEHNRLKQRYSITNLALAYPREKRKPETDEQRISRVLGSILEGAEL
jgi:hypothetical protein